MDEKSILQQVSEAACRYIYKNYYLDEITNGKNNVMYCHGDKMIVSIYALDDCFKFLFLFNESECTELETLRDEFPSKMLTNIKNGTHGKWLWVEVADMETLEYVKKLLSIKLKPNRTLYPKVTAKYSNNRRYDMCIHYLNGTSDDEELKEKIRVHLRGVYGDEDFSRVCPGCEGKDSCFSFDHVELQFSRSSSAETLNIAILPYVAGFDM